MTGFLQRKHGHGVVPTTESIRHAVHSHRSTTGKIPLTIALGAIWMVVVDAPRLVSLGPISLSGGITMFVAALTLFMLPAYGMETAMRRSAGWVEPAAARIPWAIWCFLICVFVGFIVTALNGAIRTSSLQNACVYLLFVGSIAFAAATESPAVITRGWELMRSCAASSAYLMFAMTALNLKFLGDRALALVALIVLAVVIPGAPRNIWIRFAPLAAVAAIILSLSRTSTAIGIIFLVFIVLRGKQGRRLLKGVLFLATAAVLFYVLVVHYTPFRDRFLVGDNALRVGGLTISTQGRATIWKLLLANSTDNWLFGQGLGSSGRLLAEHLPAAQAAVINHPHNEYLRFYVEFGIIGLVLFLVGYLTLIWRIFKNAKTTDHPVHWSAFIALIAIGLAAITDNPFVYPFVMLPLASLAGLSLALARFELADRRPNLTSQTPVKNFRT